MAWLPQLKIYLPALVTTVATTGLLIFGDFPTRVAGGVLVPLDLFLLYKAAYQSGIADGIARGVTEGIRQAAETIRNRREPS